MSTTITPTPIKLEAAPKRYGPFKVLHSKHVESDPVNPFRPDGKPNDRTYTKESPPFYSSTNLLKLNAIGLPPKFALVGDGIASNVVSTNSLTRIVGESDEQYAARMKALAEEAARLAGGGKAPDPAKTASLMQTLEAMSFKDLQAWAAEEEVELKGAKTKEECLKIIRGVIEKNG